MPEVPLASQARSAAVRGTRVRARRRTRQYVELAIEALDHREWPRTEAEIHLLHSAMFTAQAIAHDVTAAGRGDEIAEVARNISKVAPELPPETDKGG